MLVTVFRTRLKLDCNEEYYVWAKRMSDLVREVPGYVSHKGFVSEDGERVTIVEFSSDEGLQLWSRHAEHVEAKKKGRKDFYETYSVQVCRVEKESSFTSPNPGKPTVQLKNS